MRPGLRGGLRRGAVPVPAMGGEAVQRVSGAFVPLESGPVETYQFDWSHGSVLLAGRPRSRSRSRSSCCATAACHSCAAIRAKRRRWCSTRTTGRSPATAPKAEQVPDFFHAAENLKEAVGLAYGRDSAEGGRRYQVLRERLLTEPGGADTVIRSLDRLRRRHSPDIPETITCFRNNRQRMNYAECRAANRMIGSGIVESTNLRALALSDRFDHSWNILQNNWESSNC